MKIKNATNDFLDQKRSTFHATVDCIDEKIFGKKAPPKISITVMEAILVGVGKNLDFLNSQSPRNVQGFYERMINQPNFSEASLKEGLSKRMRVVERLKLAIQIFSGEINDS